jgi:1-acyl-sn-glycerol-3-phosphate acyltransferase
MFRRFEVAGLDRVPRDRPVLLVANHFNGFVDVVIVIASIGRMPRFVAKSTIAANPILRLALRLVGVVLVKRPEDVGGAADNTAMFAETTAALVRRQIVALFPEGTTHDRTSLARIHTGAARIALGAEGAAGGASNAVVVPVGITYYDKIALRSSVLVRVGELIDVDGFAGGRDVDDHDAVRELTELIDDRLRAVSPDFDDPAEWAAIDLAAEVSLRTATQPVGSLFQRAERVAALGRADPEDRRRLTDALGRYHLALAAAHLYDEQVVTGAPLRATVRSLVVVIVGVTLAWPIIAYGFFVNVAPAAIVGASGLPFTAAVTKGTARVLTGLIVFPIAWIVAAAVLGDSFVWGFLLFLVAPIAGLITLAAVAAVLHVVGTALDWRVVTERRAAVAELRAQRASVVHLVDALLP